MRGYGQHDDSPAGELSLRTLKSLLPFLADFRGRIAIALLCLIAAKLATVALPFVLKAVVDDLDPSQVESAVLVLPLALLIAYGVLRFANTLFSELRDTLFGRVTERAMRHIGLRVFSHLHSLELNYHLNRNTGGVARDIERGVSGVGFILRFMVFNIIPTILEVALVIGLLLMRYNPWFALIMLIAVVVYVGYSIKVTEWRTEYIREANRADSQSNTRAIDSLINYETVKYFNNEAFETRHYDTDLAAWENARRKNRLSLFALNGGQALIIGCAMTAMLILAASEVVAGNMTLGDFVLVNAFTMQLFMPLNFLGFVYREMKGSLASMEQMFRLLEIKPAISDADDAEPLRLGPGRVEFRKLSFGYRPDRPILRQLDFTVDAGTKLAVVGDSGAGKSTLVKLLYRFYDPTEGAILIDGQDIRQCTQASVRANIGIVPQDTVLFNTTLGENIRYGRSDATDEEIATVIAMAHLDVFVEALPEGLDTLVGERGLKLSGGEKQRVAIARTLLKNPGILVFDEATSSLDSKVERSIVDALNAMATGRTTIVIAHRLSTIVDADVILVMRDGRIVERGTHATLLASKGVYSELWRAQDTASA
ncbi:ABCB family ABC transporter ATP-binding protein/permease [Allohahella sp. A8]|uniref:ABCB family ABC transporter ATP-binding protein/permease n=1 Tax=Allohahella sp. A8 TaxID=3141461 RepID=UPI000C09DE64|nr:metal ABC transporter permease [Hahellaceae bacterium]|tara:strand:+ start:36720 stop:38510 length:1791 start_codon:yes stop_codon:yes gene_type:complete